MAQTKKLYRNKQEGKILGVCAGFADYFGVDVTLIRIVWLFSVVAYGGGIFAYLGAALLMPEKPVSSVGKK